MNSRRHQEKAGTWRLRVVFVAWTLFALFMLCISLMYRIRAGLEIDLPLLVFGEFSYSYLWFALTPLVLALSERFRIERATLVRHLLVHFVAGAVVSAIQKASHGLSLETYRFIAEGSFSWERQFQGMIAYLDYGILVYWVILLLKYSGDYYQGMIASEVHTVRLESQLAQARLQALKMQIQPHFLFNTLNAISVLIDSDPPGAKKTLARLGDLLRTTLDHTGVNEIRLREEIGFLEHYLAIEQTRFGDRLSVRFNVAPDTLWAGVPAMILQPLVENAIKHGINKQRGPGWIEVTSVLMNGVLRISVIDNGAGLSAGTKVRQGVGLANTYERLEQLYGSDFHFELVANEGGGAAANLEIPFREADQPKGRI
ncbi:MAG: sensor histidine kinase [Ignavibacteria bacterium]|nr:sensor histidine kinase [Ignavibacteria bacterium]